MAVGCVAPIVSVGSLSFGGSSGGEQRRVDRRGREDDDEEWSCLVRANRVVLLLLPKAE